MSNRQKYLLIAAACLLPGGLCYILLGKETHIAQLFYTPMHANLPVFFRSYLPDLLWGLSLSMCLMAVYDPRLPGCILCAVCAFVCGCLWELLQYTGAISGTGDLLDIGMYLLAGIFAILLSGKVRNKT